MRRTSIWWGGLGQPLAMFALLCQLFSVVLAIPDIVAAQIVSDASVICHTATGTAPARDRVPAHHPADCPACPICLAAALTALAPAAPAVPPPLRQRLASLLPPVRAGPTVVAIRFAAQPRGPPAPV